ncbi:MAG: DUF4926 domain-containing protein [Candidatus Lokiarchaeota archaeon]|nr:DUF4926 domain-containing protein [Candidatus Lokiarchaeota archaeon]
MAKHARLPAEGDKVELLVDLPDYSLVKGDVGSILVAYDPYDLNAHTSDFEVFFEKVGTSVILLESNFKLLG